MRLLAKIFSSFLFFGITFLSTYAIDAPTNLKVDSVVDTSVNLSWDTSSGAYMYYVSYGKTSGGEYGNQTDFVEATNITVDGLELGSTYYFVATALDENGDESIYSNEVATDINDVVFSLDTINVIDKNKIELVFSDNLDSTEGTEREFKIYNKLDDTDLFDVVSNELDSNDNHKLILTLDRDIEVGIEYEAVVIVIKNSSLQNIESGIDSIETFTLTEEVANTFIGSIEETSTGETLTGTTEDSSTGEILADTGVINLNSANDDASMAGTNVDETELENTTLGAAKNNTSLPKTGPEHVLIFILSILLAGVFFVFKYKKI